MSTSRKDDIELLRARLKRHEDMVRRRHQTESVLFRELRHLVDQLVSWVRKQEKEKR